MQGCDACQNFNSLPSATLAQATEGQTSPADALQRPWGRSPVSRAAVCHANPQDEAVAGCLRRPHDMVARRPAAASCPPPLQSLRCAPCCCAAP